MTNTELTVEQRHRDAAAMLIEEYWSGSSESMHKLALSLRAGHSGGAFPRAFARFERDNNLVPAERVRDLVETLKTIMYRADTTNKYQEKDHYNHDYTPNSTERLLDDIRIALANMEARHDD